MGHSVVGGLGKACRISSEVAMTDVSVCLTASLIAGIKMRSIAITNGPIIRSITSWSKTEIKTITTIQVLVN